MRGPGPRLLALAAEERSSGPALSRGVGRPLLRLHRSDRGDIGIFFLLIGILFYCSAALVWNVGLVTTRKMQVQTAADAMAYSAATWTSRCVNLMTGTNMMILRNTTAQAAASGVVAVTIGVPIWWAVEIVRAIGCAPPPFNIPCIIAAVARVAAEIPSYAQFVADSAPDAFEAVFSNTFPDRISEIHRFQNELFDATYDAIETQRQAYEQQYGVRLWVARPGDGDGLVRAPVRGGDFLSFLPVVMLRWVLSDNNLPGDADFNSFNSVGRANMMWNITTLATLAIMAAVHGGDHYVLESQLGPLELSPADEGREKFTVVAVAAAEDVAGPSFMASGLFSHAVSPSNTVVAYAQAETCNGIDERLASTGIPLPWPFRVWTTWGWQWQPRLTRGDLLNEAFENDDAMREAIVAGGVPEPYHALIHHLSHH
ncbi:MAG: hypothetical protein SFZ24_10370 [Planctomycetota bacterium]|nr:hypothetical protein [Planctomycetota bacterium]